MAGYMQTRKGKRPIRVDTLLKKKAATGGQDMRNPGSTPGQFKPPTQDSTAFARKQLQRSSAEVGPMPGVKMAMEDPMLDQDPLMQYLRKTAAEVKTKGLVDSAGVLEDNKEKLPTEKMEPALTAECPCPPDEAVDRGSEDTVGKLKEHFDAEVTKKKYQDKDVVPSDSAKSVVKKALGL